MTRHSSTSGRCTACIAVLVVLFSHGHSSASGRNVFTDEIVSDQPNPNSRNASLAIVDSSSGDGLQDDAGNSNGDNSRGRFSTISESLNEHFRKLQQTYGLLDLRPKEACSNNRHIHKFYCPTPNPTNFKEWACVRADDLCNGLPDCPGAEDEDPTMCMYWLAGQEQLRVLRKILVAHYQNIEDSPASRPFSYN